MAARIREDQTEAQFEQRAACLSDRLVELRALAGILAGADGKVAEKATSAVAGLRPIDVCADLGALSRSGFEVVSEEKDAVDEARTVLAEARAELLAARFSAVDAKLKGLQPRVAAVQAAFPRVESALLTAKLQRALGDSKRAEAEALDAASVATAHRMDESAAEALLDARPQ